MRRSKPDNRIEQRIAEIEAWERGDGRTLLEFQAARRKCRAVKAPRRARRKRGAA